jgi:hypothetical protein
MKRIYFLLIFLLPGLLVFSQKYTISGYIKDKASGEELIGANVLLKMETQELQQMRMGFILFRYQWDSTKLCILL